MSDTKISALTALTGVNVDATADTIPIEDHSATTTKKITVSELGIVLAIPAGVIVPYAGATAPTGWLLAYGQAVSRTTYSALFTAISTAYGVGDGATTFNVPDLRGRLPFGKDDMGGVAASRLTSAGNGTLDGATLGAAGGNQLLTGHTHTGPSHTHTGPSHTHDISTTAAGDGSGAGLLSITSGTIGATVAVATSAAGTGATGASGTGASGSTGSGDSQNVPPGQIVNYIIKT